MSLKEKIEQSIGLKIMFIIAISSIILFSLIILISNSIVTDRIFDISNNNFMITTEQNADFVEQWFEERRSQMQDYAALSKVKSMDWDQAQDYLEQRYEENSDIFENLFLIDESGNSTSTDGATSDLSERDYFQDLMAGETVISEPVISLLTGNPITVVGAPIKEDGEVIGAIGGSINLNNLTEFISNIGVDHQDSYSYIIDEEGTFLAHPNSSFVLEESITTLNGTADIADDILTNGMGRVDYTLNGVTTYAYFYEIPETNGWRVVTRVPDEFIHEPITNIRNILILMLVISLLILLFIGFKVGNYFGNIINGAASDCETMANGDFTNIVGEEFTTRKDEFGRLARAFNKTNSAMQNVITNILDKIESLSAYSEELSASAEEGNATIEATNDLIDNMSAGIQQISANAQEVAGFSQEANSQTNIGSQNIEATVNNIEEINEVVEETVAVIDDLDNTSEEIGEIVDLITNIAEQTNLLALNAAIEAARAGEHGQGFAVVAEEIRQLASETATATDKIATLVNRTQGQSNQGIKKIKEVETKAKEGQQIVEKTGDIFDEIKSSVKETSSQIEQTASATNDLAQSSDKITTATEDINNMSDGISSSSQELAQMAQELQELVGKFKV
ncbi:methyl-accepting chemotaxis protein [Natroniella sulfidigena]|uniref:methyl-accepting chemotaxis protein n=1 Tax=Natroniella sulfidigena TaxID=723921 RepID=UPI00200B80E0|nr:methyl-accepting chemotaxis protein [Natroniella sulfidigena]MCK8817396.1 methyl-accepting chemotaxis protein [Natroniella sulfidigena]